VPIFSENWQVLSKGCLFLFLSGVFVGCDLLSQSSAEVDHIYRWPDGVEVATGNGYKGRYIQRHFNLSQLHGERELPRNARFVDLDGDGEHEVLTRTMNRNQVRVLDAETGQTLWLSPNILPVDDHPQVTQLAVDDIDDDQSPEIIIATYDGHVVCVEGRDGSIQWHRELDFKINNPRLEPKEITDDPGLELALTVGNRVTWDDLGGSRRINGIRNPSVLVIQSDGSRAWIAEKYDERNNGGHNTWAYDIDEDGFSEVFAIGENKLVAFDTSGTRLFDLPVQVGSHPDDVVVGQWSRKDPQILYTDGIKEIAVASNVGKVVQHHRISNRLNSHLQDLVLFSSKNGPRLLAQNIQANDAKMIMYDKEMESLWAAQLEYDAAMKNAVFLDWDGDGEDEIAVGSIEAGDQACSLQVMEKGGTPIYWHFLKDQPLCVPTDSKDIDSDGSDELVLMAGKNRGGNGRNSVLQGADAHLFIFDSGAEN
jgi:outer membrane protein assembly factor BamB